MGFESRIWNHLIRWENFEDENGMDSFGSGVLTSFVVLQLELQLLNQHVFALHFAQNRVVVLAIFAQVPAKGQALALGLESCNQTHFCAATKSALVRLNSSEMTALA